MRRDGERVERQRGGRENEVTYSLSLHPTEAQRSQNIIMHLSRPSNGYTLQAWTYLFEHFSRASLERSYTRFTVATVALFSASKQTHSALANAMLNE